MCLIFFYLENGLTPEVPIGTEKPPRNYPDLSESEVVEDDCRDGCMNKDYFYDYLTENNGQMKIGNQARGAVPETLNPLDFYHVSQLKGTTISSALAISLLICTLRSDFEGGRKVVLQTRTFFWLETQKKIRVCRTTFLQPENKVSLFFLLS